MEPLAHSARPKQCIPSQSYNTHICNVVKRAVKNAENACRYLAGDSYGFEQTVLNAAICHDLGKLDQENQQILGRNTRKGLPVKHEDAGSAFLLKQNCTPAAILASKHHQGLPDPSRAGGVSQGP